jgi:hypothetical protein
MATSVVDEELERILRIAGIDSCPIDPSSMKCLRQLVEEKGRLLLDEPSTFPPQVVPQRKVLAERSDSDLTEPSLAADDGGVSNSNESSAILQHLKMQTNLILRLQRQIQVLSDKVDRLEGSENTSSSKEKITVTSRIRYIPQSTSTTAANETTSSSSRNSAATEADEAPLEDQPPARPEARSFFGCLVEIGRLFWVQSGGYVRPLDGALIFKLVFMVMVVTARVSRSSSSSNNSDGKIRMVTVLLFVGFLYHTRYLQYVYQFFWKENVPARVWNGDEDIAIPPPAADDEPNNNNNDAQQHQQQRQPLERNPVPPRLRQQQQRDQAEDQDNWWRNGFLAGGIAPAADPNDPNNQENANAVVGLFKDMFYLVGSFVFSIFPMWTPEGQRARQPLRQVQLDEQERDGQPEGNANHANDQDIPEIRPPRDAMEAADDDDEE